MLLQAQKVINDWMFMWAKDVHTSIKDLGIRSMAKGSQVLVKWTRIFMKC